MPANRAGLALQLHQIQFTAAPVTVTPVHEPHLKPETRQDRFPEVDATARTDLFIQHKGALM